MVSSVRIKYKLWEHNYARYIYESIFTNDPNHERRINKIKALEFFFYLFDTDFNISKLRQLHRQLKVGEMSGNKIHIILICPDSISMKYGTH